MEPRGFISVAKAFKDLDKNSPFGKFGLFKLILTKLHLFLNLITAKTCV
jgi:hypothetical protein